MNDKLFMMLEAQEEAEEKGMHDFVCPICNKGEKTAKWIRSSYNGHLWIGCKECGFKLRE